MPGKEPAKAISESHPVVTPDSILIPRGIQMRIIVSVLAIALIFAGCYAAGINQQKRLSNESAVQAFATLERAEEAVSRASNAIARIEVTIMAATDESQLVRIEAALRIAQENHKRAGLAFQRPVDHANEARSAARNANRIRTDQLGINYEPAAKRHADRAASLARRAERAADEAEDAATRAESLADEMEALTSDPKADI